MIKVDAMGQACPAPVILTMKAIEGLQGGGEVETLVDNEIAVQNLTRMAETKGYALSAEKISDAEYHVRITVGESDDTAADPAFLNCLPDQRKKNEVVAVSSRTMGEGDDVLGAILIKGFLFALTEQAQLPDTILFYNGGAYLTCKGSESLEDLKTLEAKGVTILTCGTCLNHYGLTDDLAVGSVTNMYEIVERLSNATSVIKP